MFVNPSNNSGNNNAPTNNRGDKEKRTAIGFINLYVPLKDGTRMKLASDLTLRLYAENALDAKLMEQIKAGNLDAEKLRELIQVEITVARDKEAPIEFAIDL